jgi:hypothetical protein
MSGDKAFYTKTMADIYVDQNNFVKAAEIYRYLLGNEPDNKDFAGTLSAIEEKLNSQVTEELALLFGKWINLLFKQDMQKKLKKLNLG